MKLLLVSFILLGGFVAGVLFGIHETLRTIKREYKLAWTVLLVEREDDKRKRAEAARDKEARL